MMSLLNNWMRRLWPLVTMCVLISTSHASAHPPALTVMTYNIRLDTASDGDNAWPHRRQAVSALIDFYAADLVGLQEVLLHQRDQLAEDLPDYTFLGVGRDDGANAGEFSLLAYRPARFDLVEHGGFWLSPTPDVPSLGWDAHYRRVVTWARLRRRDDRRSILALNTHWDHAGVVARAESARLIVRWLALHRRPHEIVIVLGDFNAAPTEESYRTLAEAPEAPLHDARSLSGHPPFGPPGTFNGFDISRADAMPIDHVLVGDGVRVNRIGVITQHFNGRLPSDHYPVLAELVLPRAARNPNHRTTR
jgi:endonuclease/exonuclease/phosphatase family metal-dependent hydrolase